MAEHQKALDHYVGILAQLTPPNRGDIVRVKGSESTHMVISAVHGESGSLLRVDGFAAQVVAENFEIVERAHYSPPNVKMVAMTPEEANDLASIKSTESTYAKRDQKPVVAAQSIARRYFEQAREIVEIAHCDKPGVVMLEINEIIMEAVARVMGGDPPTIAQRLALADLRDRYAVARGERAS